MHVRKERSSGRPRVKVDEFRVLALRDSGASWRAIARQLNLTLGTVRRASQRSGELGSQATSRVGQEVLCAQEPCRTLDRALPKFWRLQCINEL
jgi:IS30 family transposase